MDMETLLISNQVASIGSLTDSFLKSLYLAAQGKWTHGAPGSIKFLKISDPVTLSAQRLLP